jgi:hypothetical protein
MITIDKYQKFQLFCLESYKAEKKMSGKEALNEFEIYQVFNFLHSTFDSLHTRGKNYIVSVIADFIHNRK